MRFRLQCVPARPRRAKDPQRDCANPPPGGRPGFKFPEAPMTDKKHDKPHDVGFDEAMKADDVLREADEGEIEKAAAEALEADAESKPKWK